MLTKGLNNTENTKLKARMAKIVKDQNEKFFNVCPCCFYRKFKFSARDTKL